MANGSIGRQRLYWAANGYWMANRGNDRDGVLRTVRSSVRLGDARLGGVRLSSAPLRGARLGDTRISDVRLGDTRISGIRLGGVRLGGDCGLANIVWRSVRCELLSVRREWRSLGRES